MWKGILVKLFRLSKWKKKRNPYVISANMTCHSVLELGNKGQLTTMQGCCWYERFVSQYSHAENITGHSFYISKNILDKCGVQLSTLLRLQVMNALLKHVSSIKGIVYKRMLKKDHSDCLQIVDYNITNNATPFCWFIICNNSFIIMSWWLVIKQWERCIDG